MKSLNKEYAKTPEFLSQLDNIPKLFSLYCSLFLDETISEETLSSLIHLSLFDQRTKHYHNEPYLWKINSLLALLMELLDITWVKQGENYQNYVLEIRKRFLVLLEEYNP